MSAAVPPRLQRRGTAGDRALQRGGLPAAPGREPEYGHDALVVCDNLVRTALGRLRSLGLDDRELRRVLAGELLVPVLASVLTGLVVGVVTAWATFGWLELEEVTGQNVTPQLVVPLWTWLAVLALPLVAVLLAERQSRWLRRTNLAMLLRAGDTH